MSWHEKSLRRKAQQRVFITIHVGTTIYNVITHVAAEGSATNVIDWWWPVGWAMSPRPLSLSGLAHCARMSTGASDAAPRSR